MRAALTLVLCLFVACTFVVAAEKAEKADKEVTVKGNITCAKCELKKEDKCTTVIVAKEAGKDVVYYLDEKSGKANHAKICKEGKEGSVTGTVADKDGKKTITASKVEFK